jgi:hypothetical protein
VGAGILSVAIAALIWFAGFRPSSAAQRANAGPGSISRLRRPRLRSPPIRPRRPWHPPRPRQRPWRPRPQSQRPSCSRLHRWLHRSLHRPMFRPRSLPQSSSTTPRARAPLHPPVVSFHHLLPPRHPSPRALSQ